MNQDMVRNQVLYRLCLCTEPVSEVQNSHH